MSGKKASPKKQTNTKNKSSQKKSYNGIYIALGISFVLIIGFFIFKGVTGGNNTITSTSGTSSYKDGETILNSNCTTCHNLDIAKKSKKTRDQWQKTVARMISRGAQVSESEQPVLLDYLANTYKP